MARTKSKKRLVGTWSTQQRREAMEQSREAARGPVDLPFLLLTLLLTAMGMVMVLSASFPSAYYENNGNGAYYFVRQGIFAVLGLADRKGMLEPGYDADIVLVDLDHMYEVHADELHSWSSSPATPSPSRKTTPLAGWASGAPSCGSSPRSWPKWPWSSISPPPFPKNAKKCRPGARASGPMC
jgi:hypothetical protein